MEVTKEQLTKLSLESVNDGIKIGLKTATDMFNKLRDKQGVDFEIPIGTVIGLLKLAEKEITKPLE